MAANAILLPVLAMITLTMVVWIWLYATRIPAMQRARLDVQTYTVPGKVVEHLPEEASYPANNFNNLFQLPVVFYVLCFYLYVTSTVDAIYVIAAWAFVALRVAHSVVHCTLNIVIVRFWLYFAGALVLWLMLARIVFDAV